MKMYWLPFLGYRFTKSFYKETFEMSAATAGDLLLQLEAEKRKTAFHKNSLSKLCSELKNHKQMVDLKLNDNEYIVCLVQYISERSKQNITIEIKSISQYSVIERLLVLEAELYYNSKTIEIVDIVGERNRGYGTQAIKTLKQIGLLVCADKIVGNLCSADLEDRNDAHHKERMYHFYNKNGFKITETYDPKVKKITYFFNNKSDF